MMNRLFGVAVFCVAGLLAVHARAEFKVGAAMRVITPDPLLGVSGGADQPRPAHTKQGELTARALVLQQGETMVAIACVDALGFPSPLGNRARKLVTRIPAANILVGCTHSHSAPDFYAFPDGTGGHTGDLKYMNWVSTKVAEAINEAIDKLQPASLKIATGEVKGQVAYNYYAPDLYDRRANVLQAVASDGKVIATLVNYAIHPEVIGNEQGILSPDLVGPVCDRVEKAAGGMAIFMNSAQGGMVTADNRLLDKPRDPLRGYWNDARTWEECIRIGNTLADESLRIIKGAPLQKNPSLYCASEQVEFPVDWPMFWAYILMTPLKFPHGEKQVVTSQLNLVNVGNAQILTIPGEALPNIGFYLKRKMHGKSNMLFGLTNDAFGYILTKVDFNSFDRYKYCSETSLGEMTGEILIQKGLELVEKSPRPGK